MVRFRRRAGKDGTRGATEDATGETDLSAEPADQELPDAAEGGPDGVRARGPWDLGEVELPEDDARTVDLGGLVVTAQEGLELRLQVDETSEQVIAVLLTGEEGALELRAFAAPRGGDIWADIRHDITAETARRGGTATEQEGPFGAELAVMMPVTTPEGEQATQPSRVLGITGPRWLLRATLLGKPAMQPEQAGDWEDIVRTVVVNRGSEAMAPGDALTLRLPPNASPVE